MNINAHYYLLYYYTIIIIIILYYIIITIISMHTIRIVENISYRHAIDEFCY